MSYLKTIQEALNWQTKKDAQKYYYSVELPKVRESIQEFVDNFNFEERRKMRIEFLEEKIKELQNYLREVYQEYQNSYQKDEPAWLRQVFLELAEIELNEKLLNHYQNELYFKKYNKNSFGKITEFQILRAKNYPIEQLIEVNSAGFSKCPFHEEEKPSLFCKNNFYYCFGCGASGDVISLVMRRDGLSFVEAVKKLSI